MSARRPPATHQSTPQRGTSLIEVLITVSVLTLGIVAMANLQTTALKLGNSAYQRSQAVALSYQILDAMRSNRAAALAGHYNWTLGTPPMTAVPATPTAKRDQQLWLRAVAAAMQPFAATAGITQDPGNPTRMTVSIVWFSRYDTERAAQQQVQQERFDVVAEL